MSRLRPLLVIPVILAVIAAGCGGGNPNAPASISGSVNYKGKPVTGGSVQFYSNGTPYSAAIGVDGTYSLADVPVGELIVCVETDSINPVHKPPAGKDGERREANQGSRQPMEGGPRGGSGGSPSGDEPKYIKIPEKYTKSKTSPLTYTAKQGRQVYTIELD